MLWGVTIVENYKFCKWRNASCVYFQLNSCNLSHFDYPRVIRGFFSWFPLILSIIDYNQIVLKERKIFKGMLWNTFLWLLQKERSIPVILVSGIQLSFKIYFASLSSDSWVKHSSDEAPHLDIKLSNVTLSNLNLKIEDQVCKENVSCVKVKKEKNEVQTS